MNVRILPSAMEDLSDGFLFYEHHMSGLGSYFLETLFSDIQYLVELLLHSRLAFLIYTVPVDNQ